jgi:hypothetical protein
LKALIGLVRTRTLPPHYRRFMVSGIATVLIGTGLGMSHGGGLSNYRDFFSFIGRHSDKVTFSRTGFRYDFLFRGEVAGHNRSYPAQQKMRELNQMKPLIYGLAACILLAGFAVVVRLDDVAASTFGGFLLFFFLFGTVEYYYAVTAFLVLMWQGRMNHRWPVFFVGLLFAAMTVTYVAWNKTYFYQFCNNTVMSFALTSYVLGALAYLGFETGVWRDGRRALTRALGKQPAPVRRRPLLEACVIGAAVAVAPLSLWLLWARFGP